VGPDPVQYNGPHYSIPTSDIGPKPVQPGGIPLLVGYNTSAGLRRAARIGDGLHPYRNDLAQLRSDLDQWRDAAAAAGRDPSRMPVVLRTAASLDPDRAAGADEDPGRVLFAGEVARWTEDVAALESLGVDHVFIQFDPGTSADDILQAMAHLHVAARSG
jgi:alkanesulfonate monooxygenase SsuD/methylene tetrahydromethanopterin reductase-like flavin-dependent oxidoreductase (luciferase family)